jgi:hypothetical protein
MKKKKKKKTNAKYDYDINIIKRLENAGLSIRKISLMHGWNYQNTHQWISRNYKRQYDEKMNVNYIELAERSTDLKKQTEFSF